VSALTDQRTTQDAQGRRRSVAFRWQRLLVLWGGGLGAALLVTAASALGYLETLQARTIDLLQFLGGQRFPAEVSVVAIDDSAFASLGARQPIPRGYLARIIRGLERSGAAVVGLDVSLTVATDPEDDQKLADAILGFGQGGVSRVVLVDAPPPSSGPLASPAFLAGALRGSDRVSVDRDGFIRRAAFVVPLPGGRAVPALAVALLARLGSSGSDRWRAASADSPVRLPAWTDGGWIPDGSAVPLRTGELWRISLVGPERSVLTIPSDAVAALADPAVPVAADNVLRGRVVLVGATFRDSRDFFPTAHGRLPGVEIHANIVHMIASGRLIHTTGWLVSLGIQIAVVLIAGPILTTLRPLAGTIAAVALTLLVAVPGSYVAFHSGGFAIDYLLPVLVVSALGVVAHAIERRRVRESLGRYVGRDVLGQVLKESPTLSGERRQVSVLVSDIRGFTTLSEKLPAGTVAAHLNAYFPAMVNAIFAHRGTVDDFIGDGILAVFGAPLPDPDHPRQAVRAAIDMQQALARLNQEWDTRGLPTLRMGVAVHTGEVFAGNVGGADRVKYTVIGDTVNATARLEGLNKDLGTTMLITEETRLAVGDLVETRARGEIPVKGREEPLRVHELVRLRTDGPSRER
jgi:adenylate cyclase